MVANAVLDTTIGATPIVGDAFDVLVRNTKNMALLRRHLEKKGHARTMGGPVMQGQAVRMSYAIGTSALNDLRALALRV